MTTSELVSRSAKKAKVTRNVAAAVVRSLTAVIHEYLKKDGEIRIAGLGTFRAVERKARSGVNPRTREKINIPAVMLPRFLASKALKGAVKAGEQEESALDVREEVQRLCRDGHTVAAFDMAMKSLIQARRIFGNNDLRTAGCMATVADAARHREKYYLAAQMYRKALSIQERALGPSNPDVVRCKTGLSDLERDHGQ
jgi:nucleoid DNA-binding protein